jgi:hypothetical protein
LFETREEDTEIHHTISGDFGGDDFALIRGIAEIAPVHDPAIPNNLIVEHRAFVSVGLERTVQ